jgi:ATP-dependent protease HslVU (ClpYQ) peptidase subunit
LFVGYSFCVKYLATGTRTPSFPREDRIMTCIAADTDGTTVVLGADSASAGGNELRLRADAKVFTVGSGAMVALGALYVVKRQQNLSPRERVTKALKAAEAYCPAVRGPFHFVELPKTN